MTGRKCLTRKAPRLGRQRVEAQRARVAKLERDGHPVDQALLVQARNRIVRELSEGM